MRENISEEGPTPWVGVQDKIFNGIRQRLLDEKLMKKLGMTKHVIVKLS